MIAPVRQKRQVSPAGTFLGAYSCDEEVHRTSISIILIHRFRIRATPSLKSCLDLFITWTSSMLVTQLLALGNFFSTYKQQGRTNPTASERKNPQRPFLVSPCLNLSALGRSNDPRNRFRRWMGRTGKKELGCVSRNMHASGLLTALVYDQTTRLSPPSSEISGSRCLNILLAAAHFTRHHLLAGSARGKSKKPPH